MASAGIHSRERIVYINVLGSKVGLANFKLVAWQQGVSGAHFKVPQSTNNRFVCQTTSTIYVRLTCGCRENTRKGIIESLEARTAVQRLDVLIQRFVVLTVHDRVVGGILNVEYKHLVANTGRSEAEGESSTVFEYLKLRCQTARMGVHEASWDIPW